MRNRIFAALVATAFGVIGTVAPVAASGGMFEVVGVEGDDMLKMRAGPGTGYRIIVGLPNGAVLRNHGCDRVGGTLWCQVSLKETRRLKGYVAGHYLREF